MTLRIKLLWAFLMVALIPLVFVTFLNDRANRTSLTKAANQTLLAAASKSAFRLDSFINTNLSVISTEAKLPALARYLSLSPDERAGSEAEAQALDTLQAFSRKDNVFIASYALLDSQGQNIMDTHAASVGQDESSWDYFQQPLATSLPYVSPVEFAQTNPGGCLYFSSPVRDAAGSKVGVLRTCHSASILQKLLIADVGSGGPSSFALLLDENDIHLAYGLTSDTNTSQYLFRSVMPMSPERVSMLQAARRLPERPIEELSATIPSLEEGLKQLYPPGTRGYLLNLPNPFFTTQTIGTGDRWHVAAVAGMETQRWSVVFVQPTDVFLTPVRTQTLNTLMLTVIIAAIVALLALAVAQLLANPIVHLTAIARQITDGNLEVSVPVRSSDETGQLAEAFNAMTKRLRDLIESLERRVAERTHRLAEAAEAAEAASRAKSEFLANMSHELRTPLNGILGYAQILRQEPVLTERQKDGLGIIQQSGEHLLTLINDILDLSKIEARKMELHPMEFRFPNFMQAVADIIRVRAQEKNIWFVYEAPELLPVTIQTDEKRLRQILMNLLSNAVKFTDEGGVTLRVDVNPHVSDDRKEAVVGTIRFEIEDSGVGISPEQMKKIFQPFEQVGEHSRRAEGTGLGLAITRQLVEMMGGKIEVDSATGQGSIFSFEIEVPISMEQSRLDHLPELRRPVGYRGRPQKVLVVDDKPYNRSVLVHLLSPLGFEVTTANNGAEAIERARELKPDVIIMDLIMPVMTGIEATQQLRQMKELQDVFIIAASASVFDMDQQRSMLAGCNAFLPKPIYVDKLFDLLKTHLTMEWIYEGEEADASASPAAEAKVAPTELQLSLPVQELSTLRELVLRGNFKAVKQRAAEFEQQDERFRPFAQQLRRLADTFDEEAILTLLQQHLERPS